ncbi:acyl-carrier-protein S-malonyltransferase [Methylocella silvestris BL2]|uniref:Acyl-carrier-protein S-malonyltransferase n=1 Tax=Methylocella silvestris (strain DSM 15510 / CIP 108128 / LMG 27833 / NCIMB 13906 / BL2) TaxID=395965 RepID=B8EMG5_METSB|nr:acyltransferase domain-containing protein [Methylocella silvestris]ACK52093.1 acyl-carrier-protein S-malonyltransferase [Methylocella silvestris BL2]
MTLAILCSGQGTQHPDMFALTGDAPEAADIFAAATQALGGRDPRRFVKEADEAELHANAAGQILCVTQALAAFAALKDALVVAGARQMLAGYSIGELAAAGCAGVFPETTTIDLARCRALFMDEASGPDDGLAFVRGLPRAVVDTLCLRFDASVAIVNPDALFVLGGTKEGLRALCAEALNLGAAKAGPIKVNVASHTPRLKPASARFAEALAATPANRPSAALRLFSSIDAAPVLSVPVALEKLAAQISQTIDWAGCLEACVEAGATNFIEFGPGRALAAMAGDAFGAPARSLDDFRTLAGAKEWLAKAAS